MPWRKNKVSLRKTKAVNRTYAALAILNIREGKGSPERARQIQEFIDLFPDHATALEELGLSAAEYGELKQQCIPAQ